MKDMPDFPIIIPFERIKIPLRSWDFSLNLNKFIHSPLVEATKKPAFQRVSLAVPKEGLEPS